MSKKILSLTGMLSFVTLNGYYRKEVAEMNYNELEKFYQKCLKHFDSVQEKKLK